MKLTDYVVEFLQRKGIHDFFGYQGTMIAHLVDSIERNPMTRSHSSYNEQGASFAACGYAQAKEACACAYATSGPGAVNLLSGVADAYFDSLPVIFLTGQLNTYEYSGIEGLRQQGFQEIDIVSMAKPVTKYAVQIREAEDIVRELNKAWYIANSGRKGPVLIDLPMNIQRGEVEAPVYDMSAQELGLAEMNGSETAVDEAVRAVCEALKASHRPVILMGHGVGGRESQRALVDFAEKHQIPVITSVLEKSALAFDHPLNMGCIGGAYGHRYANMIANAKSDLLLCFGISLGTRQIGTKVKEFAKGAKILRIDIDPYNLKRDIHENAVNEWKFCADAEQVIAKLSAADALTEVKCQECSDVGISEQVKNQECPDVGRAIAGALEGLNYGDWAEICRDIRESLKAVDDATPERYTNRLITQIGRALENSSAIAVDVGQHMVWSYQSLENKEGQKLLFSGGHGAMGYALPAAIGAYYATGKPVACICGDGAFQMNIQELQWVKREQIPVKMVVMNNNALGMIRHLQRDYFEQNYADTTDGCGFSSCAFAKVAESYGIEGMFAADGKLTEEQIAFLGKEGAGLLEISLEPGTYAYPKTCLGEPIHNQQPYAPKDVYERLLAL